MTQQPNPVVNVNESYLEVSADINLEQMAAVFVTRYESALLEKKRELQSDLTDAQETVRNNLKVIKDSFDETLYEKELPDVGLVISLKTWAFDENEEVFKVATRIAPKGQTEDDRQRDHWLSFDPGWLYDKTSIKYEGSISRYDKVPVDKKLLKTWKKSQEKAVKIYQELAEVIDDIGNIPQKERQLRGKISEIQLAKSGFADLLSNQDLLKLIETK